MASARNRLDSELVRRGLARSRGHASDLLAAGRVYVDDRRMTKSSAAVEPDQDVAVTLAPDEPHFASRGGRKLAGALESFGEDRLGVAGRLCLDAGASTGGFTDVLLRRGARHVLAIDVGHDQLSPALRSDPRVTSCEGVNLRHLDPASLPEPVDLVVADLSFISMTLVLPVLARCIQPSGDLLVLVKPQFEVGRARLGSGGVVRDPAQREEAVAAVAACAVAAGLAVRGVETSCLPGPHGNIEYFLWLAPATEDPAGSTGTGQALNGARLEDAIRAAVARGPASQEGGSA